MRYEGGTSMMKDVMVGTWAWGPGNNGSKMVFGQSYDENRISSIDNLCIDVC